MRLYKTIFILFKYFPVPGSVLSGKIYLKGTVSVFSGELPSKDGNARFTTVTVKH